MGDPGTNEEKHKRDTHGCYIELGPVFGHQHHLKDNQKESQEICTSGYTIKLSTNVFSSQNKMIKIITFYLFN